ncbi:hypothetical protein GCM10010174_56490 [Kutzneria viridogrisea]|uniref:Sortase family protein n=2 Tax=Kutzneria TaxID=43356 RepID=W5W2J9_9PSEU|nr:class F sortase [Kutzneria albida]AHH95087.1 hypothetical protein KALB_1716 [Kutzneria albida DSM 43870]MBA8927556.1 hypothetical protein [Kutzneria viridogrisea]
MSRRSLYLGSAVVLLAALLVTTTFLLIEDLSPVPTAMPLARWAGEATQVATPSAVPEIPVPTGVPVGTVRLPAGGTAQLIRSDLTADGTLPIPDRLDRATWWGAALGAQRGATLLAGHVNWQGSTGPFAELWRDHPGDQVGVVDTQGRTWTYRITELVTVRKRDLPARAEQLYGQAGAHRLVLATCGGEFLGGADGYQDNRFAIAELVTRPW